MISELIPRPQPTLYKEVVKWTSDLFLCDHGVLFHVVRAGNAVDHQVVLPALVNLVESILDVVVGAGQGLQLGHHGFKLGSPSSICVVIFLVVLLLFMAIAAVV